MNNELGIKGKKVAVIGGGVEGISSKKWLEEHGAEVTVLDQNPPSLRLRKGKDIKILGGEKYLESLDQYDLIVRSPGVKLSLPELQGIKEKITSQTKLFFDLCPAQIIGVTGTKGKGTTATLIYEMLKQGGLDAYLGGNIGKPPFEFLDQLTAESIVVLELSSFQLQDLTKSPAWRQGKPHIAVVLMITSEHLDYHTDVYEYVDAKRNLLKFQSIKDYAVINCDYPASNESDVHTEGKVYQVSRERECEQGSFVRNGAIWVRSALLAHDPAERDVGSHRPVKEIKIINTKDILLPGKHNLENVCAAVMAASLMGVGRKHIVSVLTSFKGLEHRLELVAEVNGVRYYDDSFSTTPETAIAAIQAFKQPEVLILGGSSKGSNFFQLGEVIYKSENIRAIIGIGVEWKKIKEEIQKHNKPILMLEGATNMKQVVKAAAKIVQPGDVVLLSPACASFDMFKNYKYRGEQFKYEVLKLKIL